uniref:Ig-like domain-containing protein n=1 Tax=Mola mola TaxID=94237 RepID=A0A3Q3W3N9_MOLML
RVYSLSAPVDLLFLSSTAPHNWGVTFKSQCALKGTSVVIECQYSYPLLHYVLSVSWSKGKGESDRRQLLPLFDRSDHFTYVGNYKSDCSLQIKNVQVRDEGYYFFSFVTTLNTWSSETSARLSVKELAAVVQPSTVTEGGEVNLSCVSGCPTPGLLVWFRDGRLVKNTVFQARREDAGRYRCAVLGQNAAPSASVVLNVQYGPEKVSLSMSPPRDVVKGGPVTFTCSSDARPPVEGGGYGLYKDGHLVSSEQSHSISEVQPAHSGRYHCQARNGVSRRGSSSPEVPLHVQYPPENVSISVDPDPDAGGSRVNLICSSAANPAADTYTWYRRATPNGTTLQVGSGQVLSIASVEAAHAGLYLCRARSRLGENNSTELLLAVEHGV